MKSIYRDVFIFAALVVLVFVVMRTPDPVYKVSPVKKIETRIAGKEREIVHYETEVVDHSDIINGLSREIGFLRSELVAAGQNRDTVRIVQTYAALDSSLTAENAHKDTVIIAQRGIIDSQRFIIQSKDTIIASVSHDLKRVKRQRNISFIVNAVQGAILIFK